MVDAFGGESARDIVSVYVTAPDDDVARGLAKRLIDSEMIACANMFPMTSMYRWEGRDEEHREVAMFMKTRRDLAHLVIREIETHHPYEVPCAVVFDLAGGSPAYFNWVRGVTRALPSTR